MLTRGQLREIHGKGLPLHILEQDYIQAIYLLELYVNVDDLVFKGGTYIRHAFGLDRFSEDLDFTGDPNPESLQVPAVRMGRYGIDCDFRLGEKTDVSLKGRLRYRGPLYDGSERSMGTIHIEISRRKDVLLEPEWRRLFFKYPEIRVLNCLGMRKEEVLAEKLRAISTRSKGRDLYDIWFLLKQDFKPDRELFRKKMEVIGSDPDFRISVDRELWDRDLGILVDRPPEYDLVREEVLKILEASEFI